MLDLVFLVLMIIVLLKSLKGDFNLLMCNIATVVGVIAAIVGIVIAFFSDEADSYGLGVMNVLVLTIAFMLKPVAKHFAKVYQDKIDEEIRSYYEQEKNAKENFFRKVASDDAYLHAAERGTYPPGANQTTGEFTQVNNGGTANNAAFPQNGNPAASPMTENNTAFPQNENPAASPMTENSAAFPQNENAAPYSENESSIPPIDLNEPIDFGADNNYGLPYDLSAPIDLDHGIDDISADNKK